MPELSRFLGISILMRWKDHNPPHFHAKYGQYEVSVEIKTGIVRGEFPKRALKLVIEWMDIHKDELIKDWDLCVNMETPRSIAPLE